MEDQRRSERKSTIDKSNRLREIELERQTAKLKKNKADIQQIEVETSLTINKVEPEEERGIDTDQPGTSGGGIVGYNSSDDVSDVEEYLDPLGAVRSPEKSDSVRRESLVVTLERRSSQADNWSVKVNKFFPSDCVLSPPPCIPPPSPRFHGFLNQTIEGEERFIEVFEGVDGIDLDPSTGVLPIEHFPSKMDENEYKERLKAVKRAFATVDRRIRFLDPNKTTLEDRDTYKGYIEETRKLLNTAQDVAFDLCSELDINSATDSQRIEEINRLESKTEEDCTENAHNVKKKVLELIASTPNSTIGATNTVGQYVQNNPQKEDEKEAKLTADKVVKVELRMKHTTEEAEDLKSKIGDVLEMDCNDLTDQEVRENLLNSKDWEKEVGELTKNRKAIELESVGISVNQDIKEKFENELKDTIDKVCTLVASLKVMDKEKGLHTLAPSKVKENIVYPKVFSGKSGENVFKFVKDFQDAIAADQVREVDKVKKLMLLLKDDAKRAVGEHYKDVQEALDELKRSFLVMKK